MAGAREPPGTTRAKGAQAHLQPRDPSRVAYTR
jgi:hypothetical protein